MSSPPTASPPPFLPPSPLPRPRLSDRHNRHQFSQRLSTPTWTDIRTAFDDALFSLFPSFATKACIAGADISELSPSPLCALCGSPPCSGRRSLISLSPLSPFSPLLPSAEEERRWRAPPDSLTAKFGQPEVTLGLFFFSFSPSFFGKGSPPAAHPSRR